MVQTMLAMPTTPKRIVRETVSDLVPGEYAFVPPSALLMTATRLCHIQTDVAVRHAPDTTASMQITRTAAGYIADVTYCHYQWTPTDTTDSSTHAPVVHVVFGDEFLQ
ncbi:MAG: hypothetical protein M3Z19_18615 [Chloroflexota bacterium]|nr:hypothetical protein [Chloroflexota bacterium]